jgi:hypothetical protein
MRPTLDQRRARGQGCAQAGDTDARVKGAGAKTRSLREALFGVGSLDFSGL